MFPSYKVTWTIRVTGGGQDATYQRETTFKYLFAYYRAAALYQKLISQANMPTGSWNENVQMVKL